METGSLLLQPAHKGQRVTGVTTKTNENPSYNPISNRNRNSRQGFVGLSWVAGSWFELAIGFFRRKSLQITDTTS